MNLTKHNTLFSFLTVIVLGSGLIVSGQKAAAGGSSAGSEPANTRILPLSEVREGMRGKAKTVFNGSEPEEFDVEILGVVPGAIGPKLDLIVCRIGGGKADRTSVFAGMSGSPVYVGGRLLGAISYSFPFSKEPMCGITPIEQTIGIFEQVQAASSRTSAVPVYTFSEILAYDWAKTFPLSIADSGSLIAAASPGSLLSAAAGQSFRPIGTPLTFSGFSQRALDAFAPQLLQAGLIPVSAVGGSAAISPMKVADETTLRPGDSVSMHLSRGDYSLAASGTVTLRDGDKIYAFGHPFLGLGTADLPMSESSVVAVVPSISNSFKLAVPQEMVGSMTQDRATGVFGRLGQAPKMIPVTIDMTTSRGGRETLNFEIARDEFLTPLLLNIAVFNTFVAQERAIGDTTVSIEGEIEVKGREPVRLQRRFAGSIATQAAASSVVAPVSALIRSRFDDLDISRIKLDLTVVDGSNTATLERMAIDRTEVRAGETVEVQAFARTNSGRVIVQRIPLKIPVGTPAGQISITVGDGSAIQKNDAIQQFVPRDLSELIGTINRVKLPDRLYARIFRTTTGAVIGSSEMPNLPPSVLATLNTDRMTGGVRPITQTVITETEIEPIDLLISGEQTLNIMVIR